jgi:hypothetical protein
MARPRPDVDRRPRASASGPEAVDGAGLRPGLALPGTRRAKTAASSTRPSVGWRRS